MRTRLRYVGVFNAVLVGSCVLGAPAFAQSAAEPSPLAVDDQSAPASVIVGADDAAEEPADARVNDRVVVTGSRSPSRTVENSAAPIDVLTAEALTNTGEGNLLQALTRTVPSLSQRGGYQSDTESIVRGVQLRNLSPAYTLVLINGKRRNVSAYTSGANGGLFPGHAWADLSLIPVAAVERVEVLRDGASAIYGSDAVSGVINVILKSQEEDGSVSIDSGQSFEGDGSRTSIRGNIGFQLGERGFVNLSAEQTKQDHAIRPYTYRPTFLIYPAIGPGGALVRLGVNNALPAGATPNPKEATRNAQAQIIQSSTEYDLKTAAANLGYDFTDNLEFYSTVTFADRSAKALQNFRNAYTVWTSNPGALAVFPDGFTPYIATKEQDWSFTSGFRGTLAEWDWDLSGTYNRDWIKTYTRNTLNYSLTYPGSPTNFYDGKLDYSQLVGNLDVSRSFDVGVFAAPLDVSFGGEYQKEEFERGAGEFGSWFGQGAAAYIGYKPGDAVDVDRNQHAVYASAATNLTKQWFVDVATRYESNSDFGEVTTGRLSTRFDFNDAIGIRGTISNGFHAPALAAQNYQVTGNSPTTTTLVARVTSPTALALGATSLEPEKSTNYSLGVTYGSGSAFNATLDFYQIDVSDYIGQSPQIGYNAINPAAITDNNGVALTPAQKQLIDDLLATAGVTVPAGQAYYVSYFTNIGDTRTRGVELALDATQRTDWGTLRYNYAVNILDTKITRTNSIAPVLQTLPNLNLLTTAVQHNLRYNSPQYTQVAGVTWDNGPWKLGVDLEHFGPIKRLANHVRYKIGSRLLVNVNGGYDLGNGVSLEAGVNNVFNEKTSYVPDAATTAATLATWTYTYDTLDRVSTVGGYWYGRLNYRF